MRALALLGAVVVSGCATLNTAGMSDHCARMYDACLNTCPKSDTPPVGSVTMSPIRTDVASCVDDCNKHAKSCQ